MRGIKLLVLLLGLVLLVSAGSESIDDRYNYRKLEERELRRGGGGRSGGRSSSSGRSRSSSYSSSSKSSKSTYRSYTSYNRVIYMNSVYYYNNYYNKNETCGDYLENEYCVK